MALPSPVAPVFSDAAIGLNTSPNAAYNGCRGIIDSSTVKMPNYIPQGWNGFPPFAEGGTTNQILLATPGYKGLKWWGMFTGDGCKDLFGECWRVSNLSTRPCTNINTACVDSNYREYTCRADKFTGVVARFYPTETYGSYPSTEPSDSQIPPDLSPGASQLPNIPGRELFPDYDGCRSDGSPGAMYLCAQEFESTCPAFGSFQPRMFDTPKDAWSTLGKEEGRNTVYQNGKFAGQKRMGYGLAARNPEASDLYYGYMQCSYNPNNFAWQDLPTFQEKVRNQEIPGAQRFGTGPVNIRHQQFYNSFMKNACFTKISPDSSGTVGRACERNPAAKKQATECTIMFTQDPPNGPNIAEKCKEWWKNEFALGNAQMTDTYKDTIIDQTCNKPGLNECLCYYRKQDSLYIQLQLYSKEEGALFGGPAECNYYACKYNIAAETVLRDTAALKKNGEGCPNVCVNLTRINDVVNSTIGNLNQTMDCNVSDAAGGVVNAGGNLGLDGQIIPADWLAQNWIMLTAVGIGSVIVLALIVYMSVKLSAKKKKDALGNKAIVDEILQAIHADAGGGAVPVPTTATTTVPLPGGEATVTTTAPGTAPADVSATIGTVAPVAVAVPMLPNGKPGKAPKPAKAPKVHRVKEPKQPKKGKVIPPPPPLDSYDMEFLRMT